MRHAVGIPVSPNHHFAQSQNESIPRRWLCPSSGLERCQGATFSIAAARSASFWVILSPASCVHRSMVTLL